jgi:hypothetical protein
MISPKLNPDQWISDMAHDSFCWAMDQLELDESENQMNRPNYQAFEQIGALTKLRKVGESSYFKMVQTGNIGIFDYVTGFLCVEVYLIKSDAGYSPTLIISTIDDGGAQAFGQAYKDEEKAKQIIEKAAALLQNLVIFPSLEETNQLFRELGLFICRY